MMKSNIPNNLTTDNEEIKSYFAGHWWDFYSGCGLELTDKRGDEAKAVCPFHPDTDPSCSFNNEEGVFNCFGCGEKGDPFQFYGKLKGITSFDGQVRGIAADFNILSDKVKKKSSGPGRIAKTYDYVNAEGVLLYQAVRMEPKSFRQRQPDGKGGWVWNVKDVDKVLYRLSEVLQADLVLVVEGEKDADNVSSLGFTATTNVGGAEKWRFEYSKTLEGKDVVVLPDNDKPGRNHASKVARMLHGIAKSLKVVELPGLPEKGDVSDWIESGGTKEALQKLIDKGDVWMPETDDQDEADNEIKERFPRGPFPWGVLPVAIAESIKQLARSCATSATSLPGAAVAIFASLIGSVVSVCPKISWFEPIIFWIADIKPSGEGKTPPARALCNVLYKAQTEADKAFKDAMREYISLPKKERSKADVPPRARGYFFSDLTIEGLREDNSGHGGQVGVMDEISAFINSQNQYKGKGNDRESWIALHDGKPARIVRAGKSVTINGARVSIFGGIQPQIWRITFSGGDGENKDIYLVDGTIYRFLPTYEGGGFYPLTNESWSDENREVWESLLRTAMDWANRKWEAGEIHNLLLSKDAREIFIDWRNELFQMKADLPETVRGFVPKLVGYALRFAGVLYLMDIFSRGEMPGKILSPVDIRKGIRVSEFYLGHILEAMKAIQGSDAHIPFEKTDQLVHLAETLNRLRDQVDGGLLAIGFVQESFNKTCGGGLHVKSPHLMGSIIRQCGLTIKKKKHWKGQHGVNCLKWDEKIESLIETCPQSPHCPQSEENQEVKHEDIEKSKSSQVLKNDEAAENMRTLRTLKNQSPHTKVVDNTEQEDIEDNEDNFSKGMLKTDPMFDFNLRTLPVEKPVDWSF